MNSLNFLLALSLSVFVGNVLSTSSSPKYVVTKTAYDETLSALNAHVKYINSLPDLRNGSTPLFFIHRPGTKVHGTVIFFHGYSSLAAGGIIRAKYLFSQKFNVVALNLAGFAQSPKHWVSTVLRESAGYSAIRAALLKDPVISSKIRAINDAKTSEEQIKLATTLKDPTIPVVVKVLRKNLSPREFEIAQRAISLLNTNVQMRGTEKQFPKYFISGHQRYESDPFAKLRFVQALPGPIHAVSVSFGATALINLAAQSRVISKGVMLSPYLAWHTEPSREDLTQFYVLLGALDLLSLEIPGWEGPLSVPGRAISPTGIAAGLVNRKEITRAVRKNTRMLCIMAEDDSVIDVKHALRFCRDTLAGRVFAYPRKLKLDHLITPETGSRYGNALMEQIANYFISGNVDEAKLLTPNK